MSDLYEQFSDDNTIERMRRERREEALRNLIDRIIDEAAAQGTFDNLPGKGKPLRLNKNPYAADQSLAYELLQTNNYTLPWIADRNELLEKMETLRSDLRAAWQHGRSQWEAIPTAREILQAEWTEQLRDFAARVVALNAAISRLNLQIPVARLELLKLTVDEELRRAGAARRLDRSA